MDVVSHCIVVTKHISGGALGTEIEVPLDVIVSVFSAVVYLFATEDDVSDVGT